MISRRKFFTILSGAVAAPIIIPYANLMPVKFMEPEYVPAWLESFRKFTLTPHQDRIDYETVIGSLFTPEGQRLLKSGRLTESALRQIEADRNQPATELLPSQTVKMEVWGYYDALGNWRKEPNIQERVVQKHFADGRPWVPLRDDLRATLRAASYK